MTRTPDPTPVRAPAGTGPAARDVVAGGLTLALALAFVAVAAAAGTLVGPLAAGCSGPQPPPRLDAVEPGTGTTLAPTDVVLRGDAFLVRGTFGCGGVVADDDFDVTLEATDPPVVVTARRTDERTLASTFPAGLAPGFYDVTVTTPYGERATLPAGFEVVGPFPGRLRVTAAPAVAPRGTSVELMLEAVDTVGVLDPTYQNTLPLLLGAVPPAEVYWFGTGVTDDPTGAGAVLAPGAFAGGVARARVASFPGAERLRLTAAEDDPGATRPRLGDTGVTRSDAVWVEPRTVGAVQVGSFLAALRAWIVTDADGDGAVSAGDVLRLEALFAAGRVGVSSGPITGTLPVPAGAAYLASASDDDLPGGCVNDLTAAPCADGSGGPLVYAGNLGNLGQGDLGLVHLDVTIDPAAPPPLVEGALVFDTPDGSAVVRAGVVLGDAIAPSMLAFPDALVAPAGGPAGVRLGARAQGDDWIGVSGLDVTFAPAADFAMGCLAMPPCTTSLAGVVSPPTFTADAAASGPVALVVADAAGGAAALPVTVYVAAPAEALDPLAGTAVSMRLIDTASMPSATGWLDDGDLVELRLVVRNAAAPGAGALHPAAVLTLPAEGVAAGTPLAAGAGSATAVESSGALRADWGPAGLDPGEETVVLVPLTMDALVRNSPTVVRWEVAGTLGAGAGAWVVRRAGGTAVEPLGTGPAALTGLDAHVEVLPPVVAPDQPFRAVVWLGNHAGVTLRAATLVDASVDPGGGITLEPAWRIVPAPADLAPGAAVVEVLEGSAAGAAPGAAARVVVGASAVPDAGTAAAVAARTSALLAVAADAAPFAAGGYAGLAFAPGGDVADDGLVDAGDVVRVTLVLVLAAGEPDLATAGVTIPVPHGTRVEAVGGDGVFYDDATLSVVADAQALAAGATRALTFDLRLAPWLAGGAPLAVEATLAGTTAAGTPFLTRTGLLATVGRAPLSDVTW
jgi:hypothetical protein